MPALAKSISQLHMEISLVLWEIYAEVSNLRAMELNAKPGDAANLVTIRRRLDTKIKLVQQIGARIDTVERT